MANYPFATGNWNRKVAREATLRAKNLIYEENPVLANEGASMIDRPKLKKYMVVGSGPIRAVYSSFGTFGDGLFVVSGDEWYLVNPATDTATLLYSGIAGDESSVSMAVTGQINEISEFCFLADGEKLLCYLLSSFATSVLTGTPANGDVVQVGTVYYQFTTGSVDTGTPDGTSGAPWLVTVGVDAGASYTYLNNAINATGDPGTEYSTALIVANDEAKGYNPQPTQLTFMARAQGVDGNSVAVSQTGGLTLTPSGTLGGGGGAAVVEVPTPDGVGIISVGYIKSMVVCVPAQGQGVNGRFYWIRPGEIIIDPLNYATAERAPDPASGVVVFGDQFWLPGATTTEVWYFTGDGDAPVLPLEGVVFDRGAWAGTATPVKDSMIIVDNDGAWFQVTGGLQPISSPALAEETRAAIQASV